ncbi:MAG TPA: DUF2617 family protein [Longimicrobiales bacterium]
MPALLYVDQSAAALHHTLVRGVVDTARFHVLDTATLTLGRVRIHAGIIGASHYIAVDGPGFAFSEVLACVDAGPGAPVLPRRRIEARSGRRAAPASGVRYRFAARRGSRAALGALATAVEARVHAVRSGDPAFGLVHAFPATDAYDAPKTVIHGRLHRSGRAFVVDTVHAYPNEDALVVTRSRITFRTDPRTRSTS